MTLVQSAPGDGKFATRRYANKTRKRGAKILVGPSLGLVGWIPQYDAAIEMPEGYLRAAWPKDSGIPMLLSSGNPEPPARFALGLAGFRRFLRSKEYRGVLCLDNPTIHLDPDGELLGVEAQALAKTGKTKIPGKGLFDFVSFYSQGAGSALGDIRREGSVVAIRVFQRIKVGWLGRVVARGATGEWPPWATLSIEYAVDLERLDKGARVRFCGTAVPSQSRYVGWGLESQYLIEQGLTEASYKGFIEAGGCYDALADEYETRCEVKVVEEPG
jgi:hypothetical protein